MKLKLKQPELLQPPLLETAQCPSRQLDVRVSQLPPIKPTQSGDSYGVCFVCNCGNAELCLDDKYCEKCLRTLDWSEWQQNGWALSRRQRNLKNAIKSNQ